MKFKNKKKVSLAFNGKPRRFLLRLPEPQLEGWVEGRLKKF